MKKTLNISISGYSFPIEEDACRRLEDYMSSLEEACADPDQKEAAGDIELRIAEIFTAEAEERPDGVVRLEDVENVISRIGSAEEIMEVETSAPAAVTPPPLPPPPVPPVPPRAPAKRLYRDTRHKVLGGVCSGLAWYFHTDVVWIRIAAVLLALISASTGVFVYLVMWIVVPAARTPYEIRQMTGSDA